MVTVPAGRHAQLIQDQTLPGLVGALVPSRVRLCDRPPLRHRQSHHPGLTARPEPAPQARPTRAFLRESTKPLYARISDESTRGLVVGQVTVLESNMYLQRHTEGWGR